MISPLASISFSRRTSSTHRFCAVSDSHMSLSQTAWRTSNGTGHYADASRCVPEGEPQLSDLDTSKQAGAST